MNIGEFTRDEIELLLEVLKTPGIGFPIDKCSTAASAHNKLSDARDVYIKKQPG